MPTSYRVVILSFVEGGCLPTEVTRTVAQSLGGLCWPLDGGHSHRLGPFGPWLVSNWTRRFFLNGAEAVPWISEMVDEYVICAAVRGDEPETIVVVLSHLAVSYQLLSTFQSKR